MTLRWRPARVGAATFALGLALAALAGWWQGALNQRAASARFDVLAERVVASVSARMRTYEYGLRGARGAIVAAGVDAADGAHRQEAFRRYTATRDLPREFPGARGFGIIWRVAPADEAAFVAEARRNAAADFNIRQYQPTAGERYVIRYLSNPNNSRALGLDVGSEPKRRRAAEAAMRGGLPVLTEPINLASSIGESARSFLVLLPIYRPDVPAATPEQREAATVGWSFAPLVIDEILQTIDREPGHEAGLYTLALRDTGSDFYRSANSAGPTAAGLARQRTLAVFGRVWEAELQATPAFLETLHQTEPSTVALVVALIGALCALLATARSRLAVRTHGEHVEQARRAVIVDSSDDAIIGATLEGVVTDWNAGAQRLFGHTAAQALGRDASALLLPAGREHEGAELLRAVLRGERIAPFHTTRLHRDGSSVDVSVTAAAIRTPDGRCIGFTATLRDIRDAQTAQRRLAELNASLERQVEERTEQLDTALHDLRAIVDALPSMIGYWDERLINRVANRAYAQWFGREPGEVPGMSMPQLLGEGHFLRTRPHAEAALRGEPQRYERSVALADGSVQHLLVHYLPDVRDGHVRGFYVLIHDLSEVVDGRLKLRASEAFLDRAGQVAGVGGWAFDLRTQTLTWSAQTCRIHEVPLDHRPSVDEAIRFYAPEARPLMEAAFGAGLRDGTPWDLELPFVSAAGRALWVRAVGEAEFVDGQPVRLIGAIQDVTERRRAQALLAYERQLMASLLDTLPDRIYFKDRESRFLRINPALARKFGLAQPADAVGKCDADFFIPEYAQRTGAMERQILATGQPVVNHEEMERWPDREPTWVQTTKMLLHDADGQVVGTFGISRDITARRRMEEQLKLGNERFAVAVDSVGLGVWERDLATGALVWDDRMHALFGHADAAGAEPLARWNAGVHPDDLARAEAEMREAIDGVRPLDLSFRVVWPDGAVRHLKGSANVVRDAEGRALRMTGVNVDVTKRVLAEAELNDTMALLHAVLDSATQSSIIAVKPDGIISIFNTGAEKLLGYRSDEVVGRESSLLFVDPEDMRRRAQALSAELGRKVHSGLVLVDPAVLGKPQEWNHRRKDGSIVPLSLTVTAMRNTHGELQGYVGIGHDISQQQQHERQLCEAVDKANDANRAKSQFLANMSHEIRTPMNAVIGFSYLLERTALDAEQASALGNIKVASKALLRIINDVLDLSKIEAGEMRLEQAPFSPQTLLQEVAELMSAAAAAKGLDFTVEVPAALPAWVDGDATRLHQVLTNLLGNAIKFTAKGQVRLRVEAVPRREDAAAVRLRFAVEDSGIGIEPAALLRLFTPFVQADDSTTRRFGGTGLGLSIVKQLVELMGGQVGASSRPGLGSEFWAEIDFALPPAPAVLLADVPTPAERRLDGMRVLVADDNPINLQIVQRILELEGASVWLADNGQDAVDYLVTIPNAIDVVLMDVQMPVLDGLDATRRIRSGLNLTALPIIALTADASTGERDRACNAGMDDLVGKPFEPQALVACIRRHVVRQEVRQEVQQDGAAVPVGAQPTAASLPDGWPVIAGIDSLAVATRLRGDAQLLRSMLKRLLRNADDLPEALADGRPLDALAFRMHDLKGSAGNLGAGRIQRLAAAAEAACLRGDAPAVVRRGRQLTHALAALRRSAGAVLADEALPAPAGPVAGDALDLLAIAELLEQLQQFDLSALDRFAALAPQLRRHLAPQAWAAISERMENLEFAEAARVLESLSG